MAGGAPLSSREKDAEGPWPLPKGWVWTSLDQVSAVNPATGFAELDSESEIAFVPMKAVAEETGKIDLSNRRSVASVDKGYVHFMEGDVIFAKITPCMENGKVAPVVGVPTRFAAGSTEFHVLRPHAISQRYLWYWLVSRAFRGRAKRHMSGSAGQLRVPVAYLRQSEVPLPPLEEQRRIVERIDTLFAEIEEGECALKAAREGLETYRLAVLKAAVTGELTADWRAKKKPTETGHDLLARIKAEREEKAPANGRGRRSKPLPPLDPSDLPELPEGWAWATIEEVGDPNRPAAYGVLQPGRDVDDGVPMVRVQDIDDGVVRVSGIKRIAPAIERQFVRTRVRGGELLVTLVGTIGRVAIAPAELAGANTARAVGVVAMSEHLGPEWPVICLRSPRWQVELLSRAHEVARKTLNLEDLRRVAIPIPPRDEIGEILSRVSAALTARIDALVGVDADGADVAVLRQSTLKAAFEGRLVPQDSDDEPASDLLARATAERLPAPKGRGRRSARTEAAATR